MKKNILFLVALCAASVCQAQTFIEDFSSNSLGWTECTFDNAGNIKMYVSESGELVVHSEKNTNFFTGERTYSTAFSMAYAPINVLKPFKIVSHFKFKADNAPCSFLFNMKDDGNHYAITFLKDDAKVYFQRFGDNKLIGGLSQGFPYPKLRKGEYYEMVLTSDGQTLSLTLQGQPVFSLRYMPLTYSGIGFMTHGEQEMLIDDISFTQE